jgi:hypothetical protein
MPQDNPPKWERVEGENTGRTYRLAVPGGWLYRYYEEGMAFVPDPHAERELLAQIVHEELVRRSVDVDTITRVRLRILGA